MDNIAATVNIVASLNAAGDAAAAAIAVCHTASLFLFDLVLDTVLLLSPFPSTPLSHSLFSACLFDFVCAGLCLQFSHLENSVFRLLSLNWSVLILRCNVTKAITYLIGIV